MTLTLLPRQHRGESNQTKDNGHDVAQRGQHPFLAVFFLALPGQGQNCLNHQEQGCDANGHMLLPLKHFHPCSKH